MRDQMNVPILHDAQLTEKPIKKRSHIVKIIIRIILLGGIGCGIYFFQKVFFIFLINNTSTTTDLISIAASIVTLLSAFITLLSLADTHYLKKYQDDLDLLTERYLKGKRFFQWSFFKRTSCRLFAKKNLNYSVTSFYFSIYYGEGNMDFKDFIVPALLADFRDAPCIRELIRIKKMLPKFLKYSKSAQEKITVTEKDKKPLLYYLPLPYNLSSLYKSIIIHRLLVIGIILAFMLVFMTIFVTATYYI